MDIYQHFRKDEQGFIDQVLNWREQVDRQYIPKCSDFLDPREQLIFRTIIGQDSPFKLTFNGGFEGAERKQALLAPYYEAEDQAVFPIIVLSARYPVKFVNIAHRDVLGAFLSLGLLRKKLGDIVIDVEHGQIQIAVSADIADFVMMQLTSIKKATLQFQTVSDKKKLAIENEWDIQETTVSSLRLDVLIKHFYRYSRKEASALIDKGYIKVNFKVVDDSAFLVEPGDVLSCRGKGRSRLDNIIGETKKEKKRIQYALLKD
ncbi:RNA-binding protein [Amphibacillus jilinensis]|uniref:YlmH family RNA-binding protein n=1 Tax=Amphibacillus jilinensis TaxID=1216008 RepID=UPI000313BA92|nr:YlmH/Sll1252 family protein [Amphibacillus jilinensis]